MTSDSNDCTLFIWLNLTFAISPNEAKNYNAIF